MIQYGVDIVASYSNNNVYSLYNSFIDSLEVHIFTIVNK